MYNIESVPLGTSWTSGCTVTIVLVLCIIFWEQSIYMGYVIFFKIPVQWCWVVTSQLYLLVVFFIVRLETLHKTNHFSHWSRGITYYSRPAKTADTKSFVISHIITPCQTKPTSLSMSHWPTNKQQLPDKPCLKLMGWESASHIPQNLNEFIFGMNTS